MPVDCYHVDKRRGLPRPFFQISLDEFASLIARGDHPIRATRQDRVAGRLQIERRRAADIATARRNPLSERGFPYGQHTPDKIVLRWLMCARFSRKEIELVGFYPRRDNIEFP